MYYLFWFYHCTYFSSRYCVREQNLLSYSLFCASRWRWCINPRSESILMVYKSKIGQHLSRLKIQAQERVLVVVIPASRKSILVHLYILERRPLGGGCKGVSRTTLKLLVFFLLLLLLLICCAFIITLLYSILCCFYHHIVSSYHQTGWSY